MTEMENTPQPREKVLFDTRPRFTITLSSTFIKFFVLIVLLYLFTTILASVASVQNFLVNYVRLPLVESVSYLIVILIFVLFLWILWDIISWRAIHYMLTTDRVLVERGVLRKKKVYMHYEKIQDVDISQGIMERIFKAGDIEIWGGHDRTQLIMEHVPNPAQVDNTINRLIQGDDVGFRKYKRSEDRKSVIKDYDKKFKPSEDRKSVIKDYDKKFKQ
jgi:uncharacterized membrane protein YdbT with pleckstrin-like domain